MNYSICIVMSAHSTYYSFLGGQIALKSLHPEWLFAMWKNGL